jgi:spectinomycin phosphotransferase/16S rRNA (guanine(1405)-N(7))-methyltransferase
LAITVGSDPERFVLTHGEPHPANTITTERGVVLVDWDTALIAPPERDLWHLVAQEPSVAARYESLTNTRVDDDAVELYRLAWDLSETAIYISDIRQPHEATEDMTEAWQNLEHFLDPTRW